MKAVRESGGFTLVEVIVVIAILGIISATVVPAYRNLTYSDDLTEVSGRISAVLRNTRNAALSSATDLTLLADPGSGRYWVFADSGEASQGIEASWAVAEGITVSSSTPRPRFTFRRNGQVESDSLLLRAGASTTVITVNTWSGEVEARRDGQE